MSDNDSAEGQTSALADADELSERDVRALTECMTVLEDAPDMYEVTTQSGSTYTVDMRLESCGCWDDRRDDRPRCKHRRRVEFATGERAIPAWASVDVVDDQLGQHLDTSPRQAATDGGTQIINAGDEGKILDEDGDNQDDECEMCAALGGELTCFQHFEGDQ